MSRNLKRLIAIVLSVAMVTGPSMTICATEPAQTAGDDKIQVILPTDAVGIFDFILDPQELINLTDASAYDGQTFEEGATVFFKRSDGEVLEDYSSTSDAVTITNKGSVPIEVVINAGITVIAKEGFAMTDDREFTDDKRASLYLALTDGEMEVPIMGEDDEAAELTITIPPDSEEEEGDNEYSFRLTGAANKEGDWSRMKDVSFEVLVTWMIIEQEEETESEEEKLSESKETELPDEQELETVPGQEPGEEVVRRIVPVITDSNAMPDMEESETLPADKVSDSQTEEETSSAVEEKQTAVERESKTEDAAETKNVSENDAP